MVLSIAVSGMAYSLCFYSDCLPHCSLRFLWSSTVASAALLTKRVMICASAVVILHFDVPILCCHWPSPPVPLPHINKLHGEMVFRRKRSFTPTFRCFFRDQHVIVLRVTNKNNQIIIVKTRATPIKKYLLSLVVSNYWWRAPEGCGHLLKKGAKGQKNEGEGKNGTPEPGLLESVLLVTRWRGKYFVMKSTLQDL